MRSKIALKNALATALTEIVVLVCGILVPKITIEYYGSNINGLIASIGSVLSIIALGEAGIGGVVRAAYYEPLAKNNTKGINDIWNCSKRYFSILGFIFIPFVAIVTGYFCFFKSSGIPINIVLALCLIVSAQQFLQYFFALPNRLLLYADNKAAKLKTWETITSIANLVAVYLLVKINAGVIVVKAGSTLAYMIAPVLIGIYGYRNYQLKRTKDYDRNVLEQKWDGLGHHIAYYVNNNIDIIALTFLSTAVNVSVYAVYNFVVTSLNKIITVLSEGTDALFGNIIAKGETKALQKNLSVYESLVFYVSSVLFSVAFVMLIPFIKIYTEKFDNIEVYINPVFGYVLLAAALATTIRIPYNHIITAAGHYRQTKKYAYIEAAINVFVSCACVFQFGLVGVAIGTALAAIYRTSVYVWYLKNNILQRSPWVAIKKIALLCVSVITVILVSYIFPIQNDGGILNWVMSAVFFTVFAAIVAGILFMLSCRQDVKEFKQLFINAIRK